MLSVKKYVSKSGVFGVCVTLRTYVRIILHLFVASSIFLCNVCDTQYEFLEGSPHSPEGSVGVVTQICVQGLLVSNLHANMYTYVCTYVRTYIDIDIRTQILFVIYHTHTGTCSCLDITRFSFLHSELEFLLRFVWKKRSVLPRIVSCGQCFFF